MSDTPVTMTEVEQATLEFVASHRARYIASQGREGHILDYQAATQRTIPIIMLQPGEEVPALTS